MVRDISALCHVGQVDDGELATILLHSLHHAQFTSRTRVDLPHSENPDVSMHYTNGGALALVETSLDDQALEPILEEIRVVLLGPAERRIHRAILMASVPVTGTWACDLFTLTAPPGNAPRISQLIQDYPLVLEFPYDDTPSLAINTQRIVERRRQYELLLSLFLPLLKTTPRFGNQHWAIVMGEPLSAFPKTQWVQEGYFIEGFEGKANRLTPVADPLMPVVADVEFYGRRGTGTDSVFDVPESLATWVRHFATRSDVTRERFLRSAFWLRHARDVYPLSASAALIAAVQAVESLLPPLQGLACPTCGLVGGPGPTASFRRFLALYASTNDEGLVKARKRLYQTRSKLTHGHDLLSSDSELGFGWTGPQEPFERNDLEMATGIARVAAINWLLLQP